jgi:hypothetical protein
MTPSGFERLVAVGLEATDGSRRQVESAVRQILATAVDRGEAVVEELVGRGRGSTAGVAEIVRREIARQSALVGERLDELESRLGALTGRNATDPTSEKPGSHDSDNPDAQKSTVQRAKQPPTSAEATSNKPKSKKSKSKKSKASNGSKKSKASKKTKKPTKSSKSKSSKSKSSKSKSSTTGSKVSTASEPSRPDRATTDGQAAHPTAPLGGRERGAPVPVGSSGVGRVATTRAERDSR